MIIDFFNGHLQSEKPHHCTLWQWRDVITIESSPFQYYVAYICFPLLNINPATMGYISVVIPSVKVSSAEEGMGNPGYILLCF